ncbi:hypothetical protein PPTG_07914 [Phytophthora nicotianae INRA-310]|uniref:Uncharacterized protein n=1 Tax=Phytophthora nicotianae (strain INRA-310) TaxID=761204 RepID=W2QPY4_PHYN3|nr:hypothetical protein PPTG_07914 [Phytophthora nicotianae INRA-310]ETN14285.1 hypothetical protein PPTG_07914 [Phytophthora nicotianae INRA-310]
MQELGYKFRVSKRKGKKYDALLSDGRIVSFGAIKSNGEPYQQYQDRTSLKAFRNQQYSRLIAGFDGFDFVGELTRIEKMIGSQQERIQEAQNQLNLINREFLPGDIESVYRDRALTAMNDSTDKIDRLETLKSELKRLQLL